MRTRGKCLQDHSSFLTTCSNIDKIPKLSQIRSHQLPTESIRMQPVGRDPVFIFGVPAKERQEEDEEMLDVEEDEVNALDTATLDSIRQRREQEQAARYVAELRDCLKSKFGHEMVDQQAARKEVTVADQVNETTRLKSKSNSLATQP